VKEDLVAGSVEIAAAVLDQLTEGEREHLPRDAEVKVLE
jgi:hypothetical protein